MKSVLGGEQRPVKHALSKANGNSHDHVSPSNLLLLSSNSVRVAQVSFWAAAGWHRLLSRVEARASVPEIKGLESWIEPRILGLLKCIEVPGCVSVTSKL